MNKGQLQTNELSTILNEHFHWNKERMDCLVGMLVALMAVGTASLTQLAIFYPGAAIPVYWLP
jgi:hypothetical protein